MKKSIYMLLIAVAITGNAFSKGFYVLTCINHTSGDSSSVNFTTYPANRNISAEAGDSLTLYVYLNFSGTLYLQTLGQWFFNGDTIQQSYNVNPLNVTATSGVFSVLAVNILLMEFTITAPATTGILETPQNTVFFKVYPTSAETALNIQVNIAKPCDVLINFFDMKGKLLKESFYENVSGQLVKSENIESLSNGLYFIRIKAGNEVAEKKFVKM